MVVYSYRIYFYTFAIILNETAINLNVPSSSCDFIRQTPSEYEAQYNKLRNKEYSRFHGYAYDGIWTLALAVHNVINKLRAQETPKSSTKVTDFQYRNNTWGRLFREALNETDFTGVTVSALCERSITY